MSQISKKYVLNINSGKIHDNVKGCHHLRNLKEENRQYFDTYEEAFNFFEGENKKGNPCGTCLRDICRR